MKLFAVLLGALALVAGFTGGLRAYSTAAHVGPPVPASQVSVPSYPPAQVVRPGPVVKWAPCVRPAVRVGRACVTHVTRTVALPPPTVAAPSVAAPPAVSPAPNPPPAPAANPQTAPTHHPSGEHDDGGEDDGGEDD